MKKGPVCSLHDGSKAPVSLDRHTDIHQVTARIPVQSTVPVHRLGKARNGKKMMTQVRRLNTREQTSPRSCWLIYTMKG